MTRPPEPAAFVPPGDPHWADTLGPMHTLPPPGGPGTDWHPGYLDPDDFLADLTDEEVQAHLRKPEAATQPDAGLSLAAEDSNESPPGEV